MTASADTGVSACRCGPGLDRLGGLDRSTCQLAQLGVVTAGERNFDEALQALLGLGDVRLNLSWAEVPANVANLTAQRLDERARLEIGQLVVERAK